ncbi:MAG: XrtA system polysaccharide deacetylase [Thermodesulfovibrionales bacterium]
MVPASRTRQEAAAQGPCSPPVVNAFTVDVEDYYMVSAFEGSVRFEEWDRYESRVEKNTRRILETLDRYGVKGTFFVLGWIAERCRGLVRDIGAAGHEVACHGYRHRLIYTMTPEEFREDLRRAKGILEECSGAAVSGYRAASYSIVRETLWALDILIEERFRYDSSIFPIHHDRYGIPGGERFAHRIERAGGSIVEIPPSTISLFGRNIPVAGGGYLRLFPLEVTRAALKSISRREGKPAVVYLHPWEIDPRQPRIRCRLKSRLRHYVNLKSTAAKVEALLREFPFGPIAALLGPFTENRCNGEDARRGKRA